MKKLLLVAALFALGTSVLAAGGGFPNNNGGQDLPDTEVYVFIDLEACLYYPLTVGVERDLDFGNIEAGKDKTIFSFDPIRAGKIVVLGQRGADVNISWPTTVEMKNGYSEIEAEAFFVREGFEGLVANGGTFDIPQYGGGYIGVERLTVGGTIKGSETANAKPGHYDGTLKITMKYE